MYGFSLTKTNNIHRYTTLCVKTLLKKNKTTKMNFRSTGGSAVSKRPVAFRPILADGLALQREQFQFFMIETTIKALQYT